MKDKKQDVNVLEELSKAADEFRKWVVDFGDKLSKVLDDIQNSKKEEDTWEMECPYKYDDEYWVTYYDGTVGEGKWDNCDTEKIWWEAGNIFPTKEAAELEAKRRNLLTRFRAFRDECNDGWEPDWDNHLEDKYYIGSELEGFGSCSTALIKVFPTFGYFKNREDTKRAIELFGDEIKELFIGGRLNENN